MRRGEKKIGSARFAARETDLAQRALSDEYARVSGTSKRPARKRGMTAAKRRTTPLWKRVGAFVKARREELGLSQGDIIKVLGYASRNACSNIEVGIEGLPAKRIYAWADVLEVPRDAFFKFATGEASSMDLARKGAANGRTGTLTAAERELLEAYRALPPNYQRRLRDQAKEFQMLAPISQGSRR